MLCLLASGRPATSLVGSSWFPAKTKTNLSPPQESLSIASKNNSSASADGLDVLNTSPAMITQLTFSKLAIETISSSTLFCSASLSRPFVFAPRCQSAVCKNFTFLFSPKITVIKISCCNFVLLVLL